MATIARESSSKVPTSAGEGAGAGPAPAPAVAGSEAMKVDELYGALHDHLEPKPSTPHFTSAGASAPDAAADYSYVIRQFFNDVNFDSPTFQIAGLTTGFNAVQGSIAACSAAERLEAATASGDSFGKIEARIDMVRGSTQAAGGACYAAYRPLAVYSEVHKLHASSLQAPSLIGRTTYMVGTIGNAIFGVFYAAMGLWFSLNVRKGYLFESKLANASAAKSPGAEKTQSELAFLLNKRLTTTVSGTYKKLYAKEHKKALSGAGTSTTLIERAELTARQGVQAALQKEAIDTAKAWIFEIHKNKLYEDCHAGDSFLGMLRYQFSGRPISDEECTRLAEKLFKDVESKTSADDKARMIKELGLDEGQEGIKDLTLTQLVGLSIATARRAHKKIDKLARLTSGALVGELQAAVKSNLLDRLSSTDPCVKAAAVKEAEAILQKAQSDLKTNKFVNWALAIAGIVGFVATVLSFIFTAGVGAIATGALFLVAAVLMLPADATFLYRGLSSSGNIGKSDKKLVTVSTVLAVVALVSILVVGSVFSLGTLPIAIAVAIAILWLVSNCVTLYMLHVKEKRYNKSSPTLEHILGKVKAKATDDPVDAEMKQLMKRLSKEERRAVKEALAEKAGIRPGSRTLSSEDSKLNTEHTFGEKFLAENPRHADVMKAVEKVCAEKEMVGVRRLLEQMKARQKNNDSTRLDTDFLSPDEKTAITQKIYDRRAKDQVSRHFKTGTVTNGALATAIQEVLNKKYVKQQEEARELRSKREHTFNALAALRASS